MAEASEELSGQTTTLGQMMGFFKLGQESDNLALIPQKQREPLINESSKRQLAHNGLDLRDFDRY